MASLKRKQTLFSGVARKAKEIRQNSTNLAFDNKTNARKGSKIATADARLAIYVFYLSMVSSLACLALTLSQLFSKENNNSKQAGPAMKTSQNLSIKMNND